jgi:hypothetical protein
MHEIVIVSYLPASIVVLGARDFNTAFRVGLLLSVTR